MNVSGGDHEGIGEGEEGQREFEEMIMFARIGGDRCRSVIGGFGSGWDTMPSGQVRASKGGKRPTGTVGIAPATKSTNSTNGTVTIAPAAGANPALVSTTPVNKGTIPFSLDAIFRTAMNEYNGVGDTMTKALATRAVDNQGQGQMVSKSGGIRGIPQAMTAGGMRPNEPKQSVSFTLAT